MEGNGSRTLPTAPSAEVGPDLGRARKARGVRRAFLVLLVAFVLLGLSGRLGVKSRTTSVTGGGYRLKVSYAHVTRSGLASPWSFEVRRRGGLGDVVEVAASRRYFDLFDENSLDPDPESATANGDEVIWEFKAPPGERMEVTLDARVEPAAQWGRAGHISVLEDGEPVVTARFKTWVLP